MVEGLYMCILKKYGGLVVIFIAAYELLNARRIYIGFAV